MNRLLLLFFLLLPAVVLGQPTNPGAPWVPPITWPTLASWENCLENSAASRCVLRAGAYTTAGLSITPSGTKVAACEAGTTITVTAAAPALTLGAGMTIEDCAITDGGAGTVGISITPAVSSLTLRRVSISGFNGASDIGILTSGSLQINDSSITTTATLISGPENLVIEGSVFNGNSSGRCVADGDSSAQNVTWWLDDNTWVNCSGWEVGTEGNWHQHDRVGKLSDPGAGHGIWEGFAHIYDIELTMRGTIGSAWPARPDFMFIGNAAERSLVKSLRFVLLDADTCPAIGMKIAPGREHPYFDYDGVNAVRVSDLDFAVLGNSIIEFPGVDSSCGMKVGFSPVSAALATAWATPSVSGVLTNGRIREVREQWAMTNGALLGPFGRYNRDPVYDCAGDKVCTDGNLQALGYTIEAGVVGPGIPAARCGALSAIGYASGCEFGLGPLRLYQDLGDLDLMHISSGHLKLDGSLLTVSPSAGDSALRVDSPSSTGGVIVDSATGFESRIDLLEAGSPRWRMRNDGNDAFAISDADTAVVQIDPGSLTGRITSSDASLKSAAPKLELGDLSFPSLTLDIGIGGALAAGIGFGSGSVAKLYQDAGNLNLLQLVGDLQANRSFIRVVTGGTADATLEAHATGTGQAELKAIADGSSARLYLDPVDGGVAEILLDSLGYRARLAYDDSTGETVLQGPYNQDELIRFLPGYIDDRIVTSDEKLVTKAPRLEIGCANPPTCSAPNLLFDEVLAPYNRPGFTLGPVGANIQLVQDAVTSTLMHVYGDMQVDGGQLTADSANGSATITADAGASNDIPAFELRENGVQRWRIANDPAVDFLGVSDADTQLVKIDPGSLVNRIESTDASFRTRATRLDMGVGAGGLPVLSCGGDVVGNLPGCSFMEGGAGPEFWAPTTTRLQTDGDFFVDGGLLTVNDATDNASVRIDAATASKEATLILDSGTNGNSRVVFSEGATTKWTIENQGAGDDLVISNGAGVAMLTLPPRLASVATQASGTITLPDGVDTIQLTGANATSTITASFPGRIVTLLFTDVQPLDMGPGNLRLGTDPLVTTADDVVQLLCDGTDWFQVAPASFN